jgi:phage tail-like protein
VANRTAPYGAFNYIVNFDGGEIFGGFSDVSGIGTELTVAEYRNGNEKENNVRKVAGVHKVSDVTLSAGSSTQDALGVVTGLAAFGAEDVPSRCGGEPRAVLGAQGRPIIHRG